MLIAFYYVPVDNNNTISKNAQSEEADPEEKKCFR